MAMEHEQWKEILSTVNEEGNLSKDNVIEKVKKKLKVIDPSAYKEWEKTGFDVNHLFHAVDKPDNPVPWEDDNCTLLHLAARNNLENITEALLGVEGIDVNAADRTPVWTPLHYAAQFNSKKVIDVLLKAEEINVNAESLSKRTPLHFAAQFCNKEAISALLKAKDINVNAKNDRGKTPGNLAENNEIKKLLKEAEEKQLEKLSKKTDLPQDDKDTTRLLGKTEKKQPTSAVAKGIFAGCSTALLGAAIAVTLFATGTVAVELMSVMIAAAIVTAAALAVGGITYSILKPSTKMDETKKAQNVNGNVLEGGSL